MSILCELERHLGLIGLSQKSVAPEPRLSWMAYLQVSRYIEKCVILSLSLQNRPEPGKSAEVKTKVSQWLGKALCQAYMGTIYINEISKNDGRLLQLLNDSKIIYESLNRSKILFDSLPLTGQDQYDLHNLAIYINVYIYPLQAPISYLSNQINFIFNTHYVSGTISPSCF